MINFFHFQFSFSRFIRLSALYYIKTENNDAAAAAVVVSSAKRNKHGKVRTFYLQLLTRLKVNPSIFRFIKFY